MTSTSTPTRLSAIEEAVRRLRCETEEQHNLIWGDGNGNIGFIRKLEGIVLSVARIEKVQNDMLKAAYWLIALLATSFISALVYIILAHGQDIIQ